MMDKYKNKQSIGSDDINRDNTSNNERKDMKIYEGMNAIGSDDIYGKKADTSSSTGRYV